MQHQSSPLRPGPIFSRLGELTGSVTKQASVEFDLRPNDAGQLALLGGAGGATIGGLYGAIQAYRKKKRLSEVVGEAAQDALIGGLGGAAIGGATGGIRNQMATNNAMHKLQVLGLNGEARDKVEDNISMLVSHKRVPVIAELKNKLGMLSDEELTQARDVAKNHAGRGAIAEKIDPDALYDRDAELQAMQKARELTRQGHPLI